MRVSVFQISAGAVAGRWSGVEWRFRLTWLTVTVGRLVILLLFLRLVEF